MLVKVLYGSLVAGHERVLHFDERECWRGVLARGGYQIDIGDMVYYLPSILYTRAVSSPSMLSIVSTYQGLTVDGPPPVLLCFISEAILIEFLFMSDHFFLTLWADLTA